MLGYESRKCTQAVQGMDEGRERDNTSRRGAYLRCPVSTSVHFSLRNEGSSEYIRLCEGRESLCPNFQTFQEPRHQFHGIGRLFSDLLFCGLFIGTYAGRNDSLEIFALLKRLKTWALENYVCLLRHTFTDA